VDCEYNLGEKPFAGYEPNALKKTDLQKDLFGMFARRRATEAELQQGEDEMRRAQRRLDSELASGTEPQLEDVKEPEAVEVYESLNRRELRMDQKMPRSLFHRLFLTR
jgi:uncharacterized membrane protein YcjF (UPF0283 family)